MEVKTLKVGSYQANCYIVEDGNDVLVIDPGSQAENIKKVIGHKTVVAILITHGHFDHIGAVNEILKTYNTDVYNFSNLEERNYQLEKFNFNVIKTPGHTKDSLTFYFENEHIMFTGDFLFKGTIGRTDMPESNQNDMVNSLRKIKTYPDNIMIFPGHEEPTILGEEKKYNQYINM